MHLRAELDVRSMQRELTLTDVLNDGLLRGTRVTEYFLETETEFVQQVLRLEVVNVLKKLPLVLIFVSSNTLDGASTLSARSCTVSLRTIKGNLIRTKRTCLI